MTLHNAPPNHGQVVAVAVIGELILLFAAAMFLALLIAHRLDQREEA